MIKIEGKLLGRRLVFYFNSFESACAWLKYNWPVWQVAKRGLSFVEGLQ